MTGSFLLKASALASIVLTLPFTLFITFILFLIPPHRIFFSQIRIGKKEKPFRIYKFCTMYPSGTADYERITPLGKILRRYHLDELPQIINILKGEMAWVGPRPLLPEYLSLYNDFQKNRHKVLPGITGASQLQHGRRSSWKNRLNTDADYALHRNFFTDIKLIYQTFISIFQEKEKESPTDFELWKGNFD